MLMDSTPYRGGLIVFACAVGMALGVATFLIYAFGVFIEPLSNELGAGRGDVSLALTLGIMGNLVAAPLIGILSDRFGARRMILWGVAALSVSLAAFSFIQQLSHLYMVSVLMVLFAAGSGPITYARVISSWFDDRRGLAIGLTMAGLGIGGAIAPVLSQYLIDEYGWRMAYRYLGAIVFVVSFPLLFLFIRNRPADANDNSPQAQNNDEATPPVEEGHSVRDAARQSAFWYMAIGFLLVALGNSGGLVHLPPLLTDAGLTPQRAAAYAGVMGIGVTIGRAAAGYMLDLFHAPYVAVAFLLGPVIAYVSFLSGIDPELVLIPVLLFGIGIGAEFDVIPYLITRYFGMKNFGAIYGLQILTFSIGTGMGPAVMGFGYDKYGSYAPTLMFALGSLFCGSILLTRLKSYRFG
jgi:MFS family permease